MEAVVGEIIDLGKKAVAWYNYSKRSEILKGKMQELSSRQQDVKTELNRVEVQQGKKRKREVEVWLESVKKMEVEISNLQQQIRNDRGWFSLVKLGMLVEERIEDVVKLQKMGRFSDGLVVDPLPSSKTTLLATTLVGEATALKTLKAIEDHLMHQNTRKLGVHGLEGVGKTTIIKHINNSLNGTQHFDNIIWVTASKALNIEGLQRDIGKAIELEFTEDDDESSRAMKLYAALMRRKKFLLIMDDMKEAFAFEDVGIPEPSEHNNCKLVVTSRDLRVCRCMETQVDIEVDVLSEDEAWELLKQKAGDGILGRKIEDIARLVIVECGCVPKRIIKIGRELRGVNDVSAWRNALNELKRLNSRSFL